ncbi:hypothetical protein Tco_1337339 [Tanacetum coccineum]
MMTNGWMTGADGDKRLKTKYKRIKSGVVNKNYVGVCLKREVRNGGSIIGWLYGQGVESGGFDVRWAFRCTRSDGKCSKGCLDKRGLVRESRRWYMVLDSPVLETWEYTVKFRNKSGMKACARWQGIDNNSSALLAALQHQA